MTSLRVICGLGPPNKKSWLRLWQEAMFVTFPYRPNHLQLKFYTIMQDSKRVLVF